ncbi:helix-turn-helix domain-containing protein [Streptomyces armeniacus]|uniref:helix-turn-helix domain-containing protein n=1 Tax=Streptomyces armeniacus TaxID=83291 RepID=UPI001AD80670|nr:helix-turn-helix transcriptional regulator [Streptomyces armeniacus]
MTSEDTQDAQDSGGKNPISYVIFGRQHRRLREHAGFTVQQLHTASSYSADLIRKIERGDRRAQPDYIQKVEEVLGTNGLLLVASEELAKRLQWPDWFEKYVEAEANARSLQSYNTQVIHGLLQGEQYARAVLSAHYPTLDDDAVEARVAARLDRQSLLTRKPTCMLSFVIEEWVLRRPIGGKAAMREQLQHLIGCARMRNVAIQVLPTACETHAGFDGPMTLLETGEAKRVAYVEGQAGGAWGTATEEVRVLEGRYGIIRGQALSTEDSLRFVEQLAGEL